MGYWDYIPKHKVESKKIVYLEDRRLGCLYHCTAVFVVLHLFIYEMAWNGVHLVAHSGEGMFNSELQHPTKHMCNAFHSDCKSNFKNPNKLEYCTENPDGRALVRRECKFFHGEELHQPLNDGLMIPTRFQEFSLQYHGNNWQFEDRTGKLQTAKGDAEGLKDVFVADIEHYILTINHAFQALNGKVDFDDRNMTGYWMDCPKTQEGRVTDITECDRIPIWCGHRKELCKLVPRSPLLHQSRKSSVGYSDVHTATNDARLRNMNPTTPQPGGFVQDAKVLGSEVLDSEVVESKRSRSLRHRPDLVMAADAVSGPVRGYTREETTLDADYTGSPESAAIINNGHALSFREGDIFSVKHIMEMAGQTLDKAPDLVESPRSRGTVILLNIEYTNNFAEWRPDHFFSAPWLGLQWPSWLGLSINPFTPYGWVNGEKPWYTIRASKRLVQGYKTRSLKYGSIDDDDDDDREAGSASITIQEWRGIRVIVKQTANILVWDTTNFLVILVTATSAFGIASNCVNYFAQYVLNSAEYVAATQLKLPDDNAAIAKEPGQTT